jgi:hypothetical protein
VELGALVAVVVGGLGIWRVIGRNGILGCDDRGMRVLESVNFFKKSRAKGAHSNEKEDGDKPPHGGIMALRKRKCK